MSLAYKSGAPSLSRGPTSTSIPPATNGLSKETNGFSKAKESGSKTMDVSPIITTGRASNDSTQEETFINWTNYILRTAPRESNTNGLQVKNAMNDFRDGIALARLVGELQRRATLSSSPPEWTKSINTRPRITSESLNNATLALNALREDGVKLVNIGPEDIQDGNVKLLLGVLWSCIQKYQLGAGITLSESSKRYLLTWLQAAVDPGIANFTTSWNDGRSLSGLVDYCKRGLISNWNSLDPKDSERNCDRALSLAEEELAMPALVSGQQLASSRLDERSALTYLSLWPRAPDGPGFKATLAFVHRTLPGSHKRPSNFGSEWKSGSLLCALVSALGAKVVGYESASTRPRSFVPMPPSPESRADPATQIQRALDAARTLSPPAEPVLSVKEIAALGDDDPVASLGLMAYVARLERCRPSRAPVNTSEANSAREPVRSSFTGRKVTSEKSEPIVVPKIEPAVRSSFTGRKVTSEKSEPIVVPKIEPVVRLEPDFSSPPRRKETPFLNRLLQHLDNQSPPRNERANGSALPSGGAPAPDSELTSPLRVHIEEPPARPVSELSRTFAKEPAKADSRPASRALSTSVQATPAKKAEPSKSPGRLTPRFKIPETVREEPVQAPAPAPAASGAEAPEEPPWKLILKRAKNPEIEKELKKEAARNNSMREKRQTIAVVEASPPPPPPPPPPPLSPPPAKAPATTAPVAAGVRRWGTPSAFNGPRSLSIIAPPKQDIVAPPKQDKAPPKQDFVAPPPPKQEVIAPPKQEIDSPKQNFEPKWKASHRKLIKQNYNHN